MADISKKTEQELDKELTEKQKALRLFRFSVARSKIKNMREGRNFRKDIARILTELNKRKNLIRRKD